MLPINEVIQGDCLDVLRGFPAASIDMVLTSPPYDNLREYKGYTFNFEGIAKELYRVVKEGGVVVWVVNDATINGSESGTSFKQALYFKEIGFNLHDTMIWEKSKMPQNHNRYEQYFEYMFIFSKGRPKTFNGIRDKTNTKAGKINDCSYRDKDGSIKRTASYKKIRIADVGLRGNVWRINGVISSRERLGHPAPFSLALAKDHILSWSNENDIILDPMCGSGTTCVAAKELKRNFIGIEIAPEYVTLARQRVKNLPPKLF